LVAHPLVWSLYWLSYPRLLFGAYKQVKQSHYRPGQSLRFPVCRRSQISRHSSHEIGKVVSPMYQPPLPQEIFLVHISIRECVDPGVIVRPEGLCEWKILMTTSGIEPATFRLAAQCLNCSTACLRLVLTCCLNLFKIYLHKIYFL
jgi:hypothetical protein